MPIQQASAASTTTSPGGGRRGARRAVGTTVAARTRVRRVVFTGDFLRLSPRDGRYFSSQHRNVNWMRALLTAAPAWTEPWLEARTAFPEPGQPLDELMPADWVDRYANDADGAWAQAYAASEVSGFDGLLEQLRNCDLVVGFELPPVLKRLLQQAGQRYISLCIHPIRLLPDLCLKATTNDPACRQALEAARLPAAAVRLALQGWRALCRFHDLPLFRFPHGLPVVIGQTARDAVLIRNGRFVDWPDVDTILDTALSGHEAVIVLEHPYASHRLQIANHLRDRHGKNVLSTTANGYAVLLADRDCPRVLTLSSSLGVEAQAMGHEVHFLLGNPLEHGRAGDYDDGPEAPLGHFLFTSAFWESVLRGEGHSSPTAGIGFTCGEDYVRRSLDGWSYALLRDGLAGAQNRTFLLPRAATVSSPGCDLANRIGLRPGDPPQTAPWKQAGIVLYECDPPLEPGQSRRVDFGLAEATSYLASGWQAPEAGGTWSLGAEARVRIPLGPSGAVALSVELTVKVAPSTLPQLPVVLIWHGAALLGELLFRPGGPDRLTVPLLLNTQPPATELRLQIVGGLSAEGAKGVGFGLVDMRLASTASETGTATACRAVGIGIAPVVLTAATREDT